MRLLRLQAAKTSLSLIIALAVICLASLTGWRTAWAQELVHHIVQPGENLFRIGLKYGISWTAIMQANHMSSTLIYPGQKLIIPTAPASVGTGIQSSSSPTTAEVNTPPADTSSSIYIVRPGDTLFRIAARYNLTVQQLAAANGLFNPALIYAGQTLVIPAGGGTSDAAIPSASAAAQRIVIDISEQHLYAYAGDTLVYSFIASTGMPASPTWPGNYRVLNKIPNAYASTWNIWMPYWLGIYWAGRLQNGIHALPIMANGQRLWEGYLGTPVSYGCIILGVDEARQLYEWAEVGAAVTVQY